MEDFFALPHIFNLSSSFLPLLKLLCLAPSSPPSPCPALSNATYSFLKLLCHLSKPGFPKAIYNPNHFLMLRCARVMYCSPAFSGSCSAAPPVLWLVFNGAEDQLQIRVEKKTSRSRHGTGETTTTKGSPDTCTCLPGSKLPSSGEKGRKKRSRVSFPGLAQDPVIPRKHAFTAPPARHLKRLFSWSRMTAQPSLELLFQSSLPLNLTGKESKLPGFKLRA